MGVQVRIDGRGSIGLAWKVIRGLWVALAVTVLVSSLRAYDGTPDSDAEEFMVWCMLALSAPAGLIYAALFAAFASALHARWQIVISASYLEISVSWCALLALGYLQWFVLGPRLFRWLRSPRRREGPKASRG